MRRSYIFWHWFITVLLAPSISKGVIDFFKGDFEGLDLLELYPVFLFYGVLFSAPTLGIYILCFNFLKKNNMDLSISKIVLVAVSVIGVIITALVIGGSMSKEIAMSYSLTALIVGISLKLKY